MVALAGLQRDAFQPLEGSHFLNVTADGVPSLGREEIPVILAPARPAHDVDAGSAAEYLAHIQRNRTSVEVWVRLAHKRRITFAAKVQRPLACLHNAWHIVAAA